ncbi:MAG: DUF6893 family small protein [Acidimicrobiales bacterium]
MKLLFVVVLAVVAALVMQSMPDITKYLKLREM